MRQRRRALALILALGLGSPSLNLSASAQSLISAAAISISAESEIASALYSASATQEAIQRSADARIRSLRTEIDGLRTEATRLKASGAAEGQAAEAARAELAGAEERFVAELASRDRAYAQEIAVFRSAVERTASTPEGLAALELYNQGERLKAREIFLELQRAASEARRAASQIKDDIAEANDLRDIAAYELDMRNRGELTTLDLIARYEEITALDPGVHWDWIELCRLYIGAGKLDLALLAAEKARDLATDDRQRSVALVAMGGVFERRGDKSLTRDAYSQSLQIVENVLAADPEKSAKQQDVAISLTKVGDSEMALENVDAAIEAYQRALSILEDLNHSVDLGVEYLIDYEPFLDDQAKALRDQRAALGTQERAVSQAVFLDHTDGEESIASGSALGDRGLAAVYTRIGDASLAMGKEREALRLYQSSLAILRGQLANDANNVSRQRDVSVALNKVGDVLMAYDNSTMALSLYSESEAIRRKLAEHDPSNLVLLLDLSRSLRRVANALDAQGDMEGAIRFTLEGRKIRRMLDESNFTSK